MITDADKRLHAQRLAEKKLRGECVFHVPDHPRKTWTCLTHDCGIVVRPTGGMPTYVCERNSFE